MNAVVLDDDPAIRRLLSSVLMEKGYEVTSYSSPADCPLYMETSCPCAWAGACPDLIVTDVDMPFVNGVDFVRQLKRKQCKCGNIAVMSGGVLEGDLKKMLPAEVAVFLKPFHLNRFWQWLERISAQPVELAGVSNRRRFARYPCELPVDLYHFSPGLLEHSSAVARNVSKGGLLVECSKPLSPATSCQVSFAVPEWMSFRVRMDPIVMVEAQLRHANTKARAYGLQFVEPLL